jgi:NAD(P)-dependent dehydrogenase (short-subunit alcohol dehydrogenase family)
MNAYSDLQGQIAVVTGASSGIGYATALALAENGARTIVHYHANQSGADDAVKRIRETGGEAHAVGADVRKSDDVRQLFATTDQLLGGPVDILVNNAGSLVRRQRIRELTEDCWDEVIDLNLKSAYLCCHQVASSMMDRKSGTIINVASIAGRNGGGPGAIHYATAKGGLITFTKALAKEMAPFNVRVNAVAPGVIWTPFHERFSTEEALQAFTRATPLGRLGKSEEVADTIVYLASVRSSFLAGETIEVNGGLWMD